MVRHVVVLGVLALLFSSCSHFRVTGTMCDELNTPPGELPQECRAYDEKEAERAFYQTNEHNKSVKTDLEVDKEQ